MSLSSIAEICEIIMLVIFGASWPFNIVKSIRSRTIKGKSVMFEIFVIIGYCFGLVAKFVRYADNQTLALSTWFYLLDIVLVAIDLCLCARNANLDKLREKA
jgi:hypothetical protein